MSTRNKHLLIPFKTDYFDGEFDFRFSGETAESVYPLNYMESNTSFKMMLDYFPQGCWAYPSNKRDGKIAAYMFSFPWIDSTVVPLNAFAPPASKPNCYYIHDVAIIKEYRGKGVSDLFCQKAIEVAKQNGFSKIKGVAVLGTERLWRRKGFDVVQEIIYGGAKSYVVQMAI